jgi:predicted ATPase
MPDVFISYARSTARQAGQVAEALQARGFSVWRDEDLPSHRSYADVIEEQLGSAKAVLVIWSADAVRSQWVRSEADRARADGKLVQLAVDDSRLPMPFDQIHCTDLAGWSGESETPAWRRLVATVVELVGDPAASWNDETAAGPTRSHDAPPAAPRDLPPNNLPKRLARLIGREDEVAELAALLGAADLVTITGAGGVGKTRVAIEVGSSQLGDFEDGVWLAELAPVSDPDQVPGAVARAMSIELPASGDPLDALVDRVKLRKCLIVLDNCEHVIDAVAALAEAILEQSSNVKLLTSSQELLGVEGERVLRLRSLGDADAAALFAERAAAADAGFMITAQSADAVAAICRRLDGIPLAIEMAAARAPNLGCEGVLERLDDRFRVLTGGRRTALPRQRTLLATLDWSHDLLSARDAAVFRRLSVFSGGFSLAAASDVAVDEATDSLEVTDGLSSLVAKSLVVADLAQDRPRYRLLETTRAYAQEKLASAGETAATQRRHAQYFLAFVQPCVADFFGPVGDVDFARRYFGEGDNIERAQDWAFGPNGDSELGIRLVAANRVLSATLSLFLDHIHWLDIAVPRLTEQTPEGLRAELLTAQVATLMMNFPNRALAGADAALEACRAHADPTLLAECLNAKGFSLWFMRRLAEASAVSAESMALVSGRPPSRLTAQSQMLAGFVRQPEEGPGAVEPLFTAAVAGLRSFGADGLANFYAANSRTQIPWPSVDVAITEWRALLGRVRPTEVLADLTTLVSVDELTWHLAKRGGAADVEEALGLCHQHFKTASKAWRYLMLPSLALIAQRAGRPLDCARLAGFVEAAGEQTGTLTLAQRKLDDLWRLMPGELSEAELASSRAAGARMSEDEAVRLALGD